MEAHERTRSVPEGPYGVSAGSCSSGARIGPDVGLLCAVVLAESRCSVHTDLGKSGII